MKRTSLFISMAGAGLAAAALTGCLTSADDGAYTSGGESAYIKTESESMGQVWNGSFASAKSAVDTDTVTSERVIVRLHYDSACQCFVRSAEFTNTVGFERTRQDTIALYANGVRTAGVLPRNADSIVHVRHVTSLRAVSGREVDLTVRTVLTWMDSAGVRYAVWNGTISGTFNGSPISGEIKHVLRQVLLGRFGLPFSGSITLQWKGFDHELVFEGEGRCHVDVKRNGKLRRRIEIDSTEQESDG